MIKQPWITLRPHGVPVSLRMDRRVPITLGLLAVATLAALTISVGTGEYRIAPLDVVRTVFGLPTANNEYTFIVRTLRLPRVLVAWFVGVALGLSGAIMQGLTRNPLASPDITGVTAGASLAAVTLLVLVPSAAMVTLPIAALGGGLLVAATIYALAWTGHDSPLRLILVGIGLTAVLSALTNIMITFGELNDVQRALVWLAGSVYGSSWEDVRALLPWLAAGGLMALVLARHIDALHLGEDVARGLGMRITWQRSVLLLTSVALVAGAVATAGTIGFVGLIAPHIARRLVGATYTGVLPIAALAGGLIVVLADLVGRVVVAPTEIPCGVVIALIGAPFFLYLLYRRQPV